MRYGSRITQLSDKSRQLKQNLNAWSRYLHCVSTYKKIMSDIITSIFTFIYRGTEIVRYSISWHIDKAPSDEDLEYYREPDCQKRLMELMPCWINDGNHVLVKIEEIDGAEYI